MSPALSMQPLSEQQIEQIAQEGNVAFSLPEPTPASHLDVGEAWQLGAKQLHHWVYEVFRAELSRLNDVPREDEVWRGTNHSPSIFKLQRLALRTLHRAPDDIPSLRVMCAWAVLFCPTDFEVASWVRLWRLGHLSAEQALSAALWCELNCGSALRDAMAGQPGFANAIREVLIPLSRAQFQSIRDFAHELNRGVSDDGMG